MYFHKKLSLEMKGDQNDRLGRHKKNIQNPHTKFSLCLLNTRRVCLNTVYFTVRFQSAICKSAIDIKKMEGFLSDSLYNIVPEQAV